jgi:membrane-associated phospholipid phosphatase
VATVFQARAAPAQDLRHDPGVDATVTIAGAAAFVGSEVVIRTTDPQPCRWCDRDAAGRDTLNALDKTARRLRWSNPYAADLISDVTAFVVTPLVAAGTDVIAARYDARSSGDGTDLVVVAEAGVLAADVNELTKLLVLRERPDVHALSPEARSARTPQADDDLSFDSGHTAESVSLAVAAGTVASMRGYRLAPLVWAAALPPALVTGYLRIGADRHYFTDVLAGAVSGAVVGFLVPYVFHPAATAPSAQGASAATVSGMGGASMGQSYVLGYAGAW